MHSSFISPVFAHCEASLLRARCLTLLLGWGLAAGPLPAPAAEVPIPARQDEGPPSEATGQPVDFARDVLPIFSDRCFQCHGPDAKEGRKADLRLDVEEDAKRDRGGYHVVSEGDLEASE